MAFNVSYDLRPYEKKQTFNLPLSLSKNSRHQKMCISDGCVNIWHGKISRCPTLMYIEEFNRKFSTSFPSEGVMELNSCPDKIELIKALTQEVPLCKYCIKNEIEWESCGKGVALKDFTVMD